MRYKKQIGIDMKHLKNKKNQVGVVSLLLLGVMISSQAIASQPIVPKAKAQKTEVDIPLYYGPALCKSSQYKCIKVKAGESWNSLFPNEAERDLVQRVNRTYNWIGSGKILAVPVNLSTATIFDLAPFTQYISDHEKQIIVDQDKLAWAAYDEDGKLVKWGPISSGRTKCPDSAGSCLTLTGVYRVFSKEDARCKSDIFPIGKGGAKMPFCMFFHKGFALHGANDIPGYRASHGCVRLFERDAEWLNKEFVEAGNDKNEVIGTKVVIRPVSQIILDRKQ
jgi:lipoprotein-anchoring transpeptidase ErfK/SrfK